MQDRTSSWRCLVRSERCIIFVAGALMMASSSAGQAGSEAANAAALSTSGRQRAVFVENRGQWDGDFSHKVNLGAMTVFVERNGWTFTVAQNGEITPSDRDHAPDQQSTTRRAAVKMHFADSHGASEVVPGPRSPGVHNYFLGNDPARWRSELPLHEGVRLVGIRPGVDVDCRTVGGVFEYDLLVSPGVDLAGIVIEVKGASGLRLDADGALVIETELGPVLQPRATSWQTMPDGGIEPVSSDYVILGNDRFGFAVPDWDSERPLVIDPVLLFSSFFGAGSWDRVKGVATDPSGAVTIGGDSDSGGSFPTTPGAYVTTPSGTWDAYVSRFSSDLTALVFSTFMGGPASVRAIAVDPTGAPVVVGSAANGFPTTLGSYQPYHAVGCCNPDAFVTRLNSSGSALVFSTFLGGVDYEVAYAVALHPTGDVIVAGAAGPGFPTTPGAYDQTHNHFQDAFVARLSASGNALVHSTYLGGTYDDIAYGVAVDPAGEVTVGGMCRHSDFPTTPGAYDTTYNNTAPAGSDGFVARLSPSLGSLVYSTYIGGNNEDWVNGIALASSGEVTLTGQAGTGFPTVPFKINTGVNAFAARLDATGSALIFSRVVSGSGDDWGNAVVVDGAGRTTIGGRTASLNFDTTPGAFDPSFNGTVDAFVARFDAVGVPVYSTYLGSAGSDFVEAMATDPAGVVTLAGATAGAFPTSVGAYDVSFNGGISDVFVTRLQLTAFSSPLMAFPDVQSVSVGSIYGLAVIGPPGAAVALLFDPVSLQLALPPHGVLGVGVPSLLTLDGIGLGLPGSIPLPLTLGTGGVLYFSYTPVPAPLLGTTLYAQAVAVHTTLPGTLALSTHGNPVLATPACKVTFVP